MYFFSRKVFAMKERPVPFFYSTHIQYVYYSVEYMYVYLKAQLGTTVVFGTKRIKCAITLRVMHLPLYTPPPPLHMATKYVYFWSCVWLEGGGAGAGPFDLLQYCYNPGKRWGRLPIEGGGLLDEKRF